MEMAKLNDEIYDDGSAKYTYRYNGANNADHMKQLVTRLEDQYGEVSDIIAKRLDKDSKKNIDFFRRYHSLKEFNEKFSDDDYNNSELYEISNNSYYIRINNTKKNIVVFDYDDQKSQGVALSKKM